MSTELPQTIGLMQIGAFHGGLQTDDEDKIP